MGGGEGGLDYGCCQVRVSCTRCFEETTLNMGIFLRGGGMPRPPRDATGSVPAGGWRAAAVGGWWDGKGVARREGAAVRRGGGGWQKC